MSADDGMRPTPGRPVRDTVELRLPADSAYLSVLRTATAGLAAKDQRKVAFNAVAVALLVLLLFLYGAQ